MYETNDKYNTLLDEKRIVAVQRGQSPYKSEEFARQVQPHMWIRVYLKNREKPIDLEYVLESATEIGGKAHRDCCADYQFFVDYAGSDS